MQGAKTREQIKRTLEKKPDVPKAGESDPHPERSHGRARATRTPARARWP